MGLWDRTKSFFTGAPTQSSYTVGGADDPVWTQTTQKAIAMPGGSHQLLTGQPAPRRGDKELMAAYRNIPMLYSVVSKIADNAACVPLRLYVSTKDKKGVRRIPKRLQSLRRNHFRKELFVRLEEGEIEEIEDHPLLDMLDNPNDQMDGRALMFLTHAWLDIVGEAFWILERNLLGMPVKAWPVPSHWVQQFPTGDKREFIVTMGSTMVHVDERDMLWFRHPDLESPYGRGTAAGAAVADDIDVDEYAVRHINSFFHNRALPDMIVSVTEADDAQMQRARQMWERENLGFRRAYKTAWISGEVNVQRLDTAFADLGLVELRRYTRDVIYQTFGISPEMMGVLDDSNRATISEARYLFSENVLVPRLDLVVAELQRKVVPLFDEKIVIGYDDPVPDDNEFRLKVIKEFPHAVSLNEVRALGSFPERSDMDKVAVFDDPIIVDTLDDYENPEVTYDDGMAEEEAGADRDPEEGGDEDPDREGRSVFVLH